MQRTMILTVFIAIAMSSSGLVAQNLQRLSSDEIEGRQVRGIDLNQVTTVNAVTRTLNAAHVPGGIGTITTCGVEQSHDLTPLGPTLRDALDSIVVADPQYRWYLDQGVVNFAPSNNEPTLLDVVITNFKVERGKTQDDIVRELLALPEIGEGITRLQLSQGFTEIGIRSLARPGFSQGEENKGFALHLRNTTVREALNAVARAHGSAAWSYQEKRCNGPKEFSIRFLAW
jgi:hypothetical protein